MMLARRTGDHYMPGTGFTPERMASIKEIDPRSYELYNLNDDVGQTRFVQDVYPKVFDEMKSELDKIFSDIQNDAPVWTREDY